MAKAKTAKKRSAKKPAKHIDIPKTKREFLELRLIGTSMLVAHKFSEKAKQMMRDKQQKQAKGKREAKDPEAEFNGARYRMNENGVMVDAFPSLAIKKSLIAAARMVEGVPMTLIRQVIHVNQGEEFVPIQGLLGEEWVSFRDEPYKMGRKEVLVRPELREDPVRVGGKGPGTGSADLRYRPAYFPWSIPVMVSYLSNVLTADQVLNLFFNAGFGCGLGENRPERTGGDWGTFEVVANKIYAEAAE